MERVPRLFVISGPSGAGKGTILKRVLEERPELSLTVSVTTREPREGEIDGIAYYFMDEAAFDKLVDEDAFLEWAEVHGHRYGTLKSEVDRLIAEGHSVVLEIDVQGAFNVKAQRPDAVLVFVCPPSMQELERRLRGRKSESEEDIALRLKNAQSEMELGERYDARIINDKLEKAVEDAIAQIDAAETIGGADNGNHDSRD